MKVMQIACLKDFFYVVITINVNTFARFLPQKTLVNELLKLSR